MSSDNNGDIRFYVILLLLGVLIGGLAAGLYAGKSMRAALSQAPQKESSATPLAPATPVSASESIDGTRTNAIVRATRKVSPCVVGIVVTQIEVVQSRYYVDDFFDHFFAPEYVPSIRQVENMGSGFVIRSDGLILTNYHVVVGAQKLFVNFPDGRQLEGTIAGADPQTDIALIAVKADRLECVKMGDSDNLMTGEWAIAIGNPFLNFINDAHPTVTVGVVSALDRNFAPSQDAYYQGMIQTDAAINPGNSGGPLVNATGEVIGINTFIFTGSKENRGSVGIGFAIPIERARRVSDELIKYGRKRQVWTGLAVQNLTRSVAMALGYDRTDGVAVVELVKGSPGDRAGLRKGDIILRLGTRQIQSAADIEGFWLDYFVGDAVPITLRRQSQTLSAQLTLAEYPADR